MQNEKYMEGFKILGQNVQRYMEEKGIEFDELSKKPEYGNSILRKLLREIVRGYIFLSCIPLQKHYIFTPMNWLRGVKSMTKRGCI